MEARDYRCVFMAEARCLTANGMLRAQWPRRAGAEGRETGKERRREAERGKVDSGITKRGG